MIKDFFKLSELSKQFYDMKVSLLEGKNVSCFGANITEKILFAAELDRPIFFITSDLISAKKIFELACQVFGEQVLLLPEGPDVLIYKHAQSKENFFIRTKTLVKMAQNQAKFVVCPIDAMSSLCPKPELLKKSIINLSKDSNYVLSDLVFLLQKIGYRRENMVDAPGQFSLRGDILDIFPVMSELPYRIDFFDNQIEKICLFDINTQKICDEVEQIDIVPLTNLLIQNQDKVELLNSITRKINNSKLDFVSCLEQIKFKLETNISDYSLDFCIPLIEEKFTNIFEYISPNTVFLFDECKLIFDELNSHFKEFLSRKESLKRSEMILDENNLGIFDNCRLLNMLKNYNCLGFLKLTTDNKLFKTDFAVSVKSSSVMRYTYNYLELSKAIESWHGSSFLVYIFGGDIEKSKQIQKNLENYNVFLDLFDKKNKLSEKSLIFPYELSSGFILPQDKIVVLGTYDVLPKKKSAMMATRESVFSIPKIGDYVVHEIHGIGICEGITKLTGNFGTKDFIVVRYRGDDKLYVPIDQVDLLEKFSGAESPLRLSRIGGVEFAGVKEKVRSSIRKMAFDLLKLYAERESKKGFRFPNDDALQLEFENAFPYIETEDQLTSLSEIKRDMQSDKVMDRLLCGDVGFGKTEVAFRAAFKAVMASKQVVFLAPTTILSEQHFKSAVQRFKNFGVNLAVINRFKPSAQVKTILKQLKNGEIDILFGTHRVLSKDVIFKDLGLIILDEEQKFGVEDKEKLKLLKNNVDVLSLSATPIPRTLNMSMSGIRDISIISTPPMDRLPIQTFVTEEDDSIIKDAIDREIMRGGQVFFVYNRVESIEQKAEKIRKLCPQAKIVVGHGQLPAHQLESVIYEFNVGRADVLICTTIIENGIDIANANTLLVHDSDKFGLSQLYQIRGRVGRGNRVAYAYFLYNPSKILTEDAQKRLDAISEFTEFGSGFKVAMRDLEIRGSGNILGKEQHGHLQKVGYDLYCKILAEEIAKLKNGDFEKSSEVIIKIDVDAFIPKTYIENDSARIVAYKNISYIKTKQDRDKLYFEFKDGFGEPPQPVVNILEIALIKSMSRILGIIEVISSPNEVKFVFEKGKILMEEIAVAVSKFRDIASLEMNEINAVKLRAVGYSPLKRLDLVKEFLNYASSAKK